MRGRNFRGATLADCSCSIRSTTEYTLFTLMSTLPATELKRRVNNIEDPDTRALAQVHMDALTDDWDGPIKE